MTETQVRVQIFFGNIYLQCMDKRKKKAETSKVYKERCNMKKGDVAKLFDNREAQVC